MTRRVARLLALVVGGLLGWALVVACTVEEFAAPEHARLGASYVTTGITVSWRATCGSVSASGLYTAPSTTPSTGKCLVIATRTDNGHADTATASIASAVVTRSVPFGPYNLGDGAGCGTPFTLGHDAVGPGTILARLAEARSCQQHLVLAMTAGHLPYLTNGVFDRAKWNARMQTFNTAAIRTAVAQGVADGTILGANVMDEPQVSGLGDGNTWGPKGTMTKLRVDSLCGYVRGIFPTLPAGVAHRHDVFEPTKGYRVCDFLIDQYTSMAGDITTFRDAGLAMAARDGMAWLPSLNVLNGGTQDRDGVWDCPWSGLGTYAPNCWATPEQVTAWGTFLGARGCALLMWRRSDAFLAVPANGAALTELGRVLAQQPATRCGRP